MAVPKKEPGDWYLVQLRDPGFTVMRGAFTGGSVPLPEFGTRCVCCDRETDTTRSYDSSSDRVDVDPIELPLCRECEPHVPRNSYGTQFAAIALVLSIGLGLYGIVEDKVPLIIAGLAISGVLGLIFLAIKQKRRRMAATGHHIGFELSALAGLCNVRTTNPRLAEELATRNRERVHKAE